FYPTDILTILNSAPSAPTSITFNPPAPTAGVDIAATAVGSVDPDADPLTYEYQWAVSKDGGLTYGPWTVNGTPLSGSATAPNDRWECQARATDGTLFSPWFLSSPVLIVIVPPPTVVSATYVDLTHVDLLFSQDLGLATSQQASNYQVSPALAVSGAVRGADLRTVHLTTGTQTSGTTYTATVSGVQNSLGIPIVKGSGDTALWTTPTAVTAWTPQGSNVPAELPTLTATFSAAMNQATAEDAFTISPAQAGGVTHGWPGAFSWVGNKLQYKLSTSLAKHTTYTVKIAASATSAAGGAMGADKTWTFSTDNLPAVSSYAPTGTAVPLSNTGQVIKIGFNQAMNKAAVQGALWVYPATSTPGSPTRPDGTFSWVGNEMSYTLSSTLAPRTSYTVKLGTGAKSSAGVARATDFVWTFKTNDEPVVILQAPTGTAVPLSTSGKVVRIGFNRAMNKAAVQGALWIYKAASTPTSPTRPAGAFSWVGNEMRYTFTSKLVPLTDYTVKLGTGAKSSTGVNLGNVFEWTFTTSGASTSPGTLTLAAAPTASGAQITLSLASAADVTVTVRNLAGREVAVLKPDALTAGVHSLLWNGKSRIGTRVPPGTYLVQVCAHAADGTTVQALTSLPLR
ncbi:MAG: Ig-like domain-containing protein, partial [Armatimonadota bacterium]